MSWQYLRVADEIAELLRLRREAAKRGARSADAVRHIDARIEQLRYDDDNYARSYPCL
jgi:hypothetical protein